MSEGDWYDELKRRDRSKAHERLGLGDQVSRYLRAMGEKPKRMLPAGTRWTCGCIVRGGPVERVVTACAKHAGKVG